MKIRGKIVFQGDLKDISGASVSVRIQDVSRADGPSVTISEYRIEKLPVGTNTRTSVPFEITMDIIPTRAYCTIWAHIDVDGDDQVSIGDYITMESFPVTAASSANFVVVRVRQVK